MPNLSAVKKRGAGSSEPPAKLNPLPLALSPPSNGIIHRAVQLPTLECSTGMDKDKENVLFLFTYQMNQTEICSSGQEFKMSHYLSVGTIDFRFWFAYTLARYC